MSRPYRSAAQNGSARAGHGGQAEQIRERDRRDREREVSPLVQAPDAVLVDSTALDIEETARVIALLANTKSRD